MSTYPGDGVVRFWRACLLTLVVSVVAGLVAVPFDVTTGFVIGLWVFIAGLVLSVAYAAFAAARDRGHAVSGALAGVAIVTVAAGGMMLLLWKTSS